MFGFSVSTEGGAIIRPERTSKSQNILFSSFEDYSVKLEETICWMESIGVRVHDQARHKFYLKVLKQYTKDSSSFIEIIARDENIVKIIFETYEMVRIYRNFNNIEPIGLKEKLQIFVNGVNFYNIESSRNSGNSARNYGVEISFGGEMAMLGLAVSYGDSNYPEPMVHTEIGDFAIECKRPSSSSIDQIKKMLKDGTGQTLKHKETNEKVKCSAVVLDVTKFMNPECVPFKPSSNITDSDTFKELLKPVREIVKSHFQDERYQNLDFVVLRTTYPILHDNSNSTLQWCSRPLYISGPHGDEFVHFITEKYTELSFNRTYNGSSTLNSERNVLGGDA